jgi:hypothetical protein
LESFVTYSSDFRQKVVFRGDFETLIMTDEDVRSLAVVSILIERRNDHICISHPALHGSAAIRSSLQDRDLGFLRVDTPRDAEDFGRRVSEISARSGVDD